MEKRNYCVDGECDNDMTIDEIKKCIRGVVGYGDLCIYYDKPSGECRPLQITSEKINPESH